MLEVFDNGSIRCILRVRRRDCVPSVDLRRRLCLKNIPALFVQRRPRWLGHSTRLSGNELIIDFAHTASHVAQTNWGPAEDVGNHDRGRPGTPVRTASLRPRTMEKGLGENL